MIIDITTTALIRPLIFQKTLNQFVEKLFGPDLSRYRYIINIDWFGEDNYSPQHMLNVLLEYFSEDQIVYRISRPHSFSKALKWVWSQVESDIFFHLEDDWDLYIDLDLSSIYNILISNEDLAGITFGGFSIGEGIVYDNNCRQCSRWYGLRPSLMKRKFMREILPYLNDTGDPEVQISHIITTNNLQDRWKFAVYNKDNQNPIIGDGASDWRNKLRISKQWNGTTEFRYFKY